jgi:hypothetical protein
VWIQWITTIAKKPRQSSHVLPSSRTKSIEDRNMALHFLPKATDTYDAAVEDAIASCNGDIRGALKALIIANEFLERDLEKALATSVAPSIAPHGNGGLRRVHWVEAADGWPSCG